MKPGHVRLVLAGFFIFAVVVALNATLMQGDLRSIEAVRHANEIALGERQKRLVVDIAPNLKSAAPMPIASPIQAKQPEQPQFRAPTREETAVRFARLRPDAAKSEQLPHAPDAEGAPETIRAVQRELTARNYGPLIADGMPGQATRAAIMAFEHDNKLALTGEATETLLKRILLGPSGSGLVDTASGHGKVRSQHAEQMIRTVQQSLVTLGYQPGRVDGRMGEESVRAVREYEMDNGLVPSGRISAELFTRLARSLSASRPAQLR